MNGALVSFGHFVFDGAIDEAGASLTTEVGEEPLGEDDEPVTETDEIEDVDKAPGKPGEKAAELDFAKCADCFGSTNGSHGSFVEVAEGRSLRFG